MRQLFNLHAIAHHRTLLVGVALGMALAMPARALGQAQDQEPIVPATSGTEEPILTEAPQPADTVDEADPAMAGDVALSEEQVIALQDTLKDLGYFFGPSDGRKGPRTRTALRNFQRDQGLSVSGSFDDATLARIADQSRMARTEHRPSANPVTAPAASYDGGGGSRLRRVGGAVKTGVGTGVGAVGTAGRTTGRGFGNAGRAVGNAGEATWNAGTTAGRAVADGSVFVYSQGRRAIFGDKGSKTSSDEKIRAAIERQYSEEDRIVPGEIEIRVSKGNVTLALPEGARSDMAHAVRIAKLTAGVQSVTSVYVSVNASDGAQVTPQP